jgi:trans-aconitate 2-methyltransferase
MQPSADEVRSFYDKFLQQRMLNYRVEGNIRIELATKFFCSNLRYDDVVVDVGCGIGIATEAMAKAAPCRLVIGLDISKENIWYAKKTITLANVSFHCVDVTENPGAVLALLPRKPTVITMCDVIEHIPEDARVAMLRGFVNMCSNDLKVLLTFPSVYYQEFLRRESPEELQIIDNSIGPEVLSREAHAAGLSITSFALVNVWRKAQYVHSVLEREDTLRQMADIPRATTPSTISVPFFRRLRLRYLRAKYIDHIFGSRQTPDE